MYRYWRHPPVITKTTSHVAAENKTEDKILLPLLEKITQARIQIGRSPVQP